MMLASPPDAPLLTLDDVLLLEGAVARKTLPHGISARVITLAVEEMSILRALIAEAKARLLAEK